MPRPDCPNARSRFHQRPPAGSRPPSRRARAVRTLAAVFLAALAGIGCGGGTHPSSPTSPTPAPVPPATPACEAISGGFGLSLGIVNGSLCSSVDSSVVLVYRKDETGRSLGYCSGTVIGPRAVLTAAHCLGSDTAAVDIDPGSGPWVAGISFTPHPTYPRWALDAGVVLTADDLRRNPLPILTSRVAIVGESVVIAGWGRDANEIGSVLRAGLAEITRVGAVLLQTDYSGGDAGSGICAGDSGGPLLLREGGAWAVGGIAAAASQLDVCSAATTGYYAQLANAEILEFVLKMAPDVAQR